MMAYRGLNINIKPHFLKIKTFFIVLNHIPHNIILTIASAIDSTQFKMETMTHILISDFRQQKYVS